MKPLLTLFLTCLAASAATPSFSSFNTNQFSTNNLFISIKDGVLITNLNTRSFTSLPGETITLNNVSITNWTDITGLITINPTDNYLPYRSNATTFGDSPFYSVSSTNVALNSQIVFGPGITNYLQRVDGASIRYTASSAVFQVQDSDSGLITEIQTGASTSNFRTDSAIVTLENATRVLAFYDDNLQVFSTPIDIGQDYAPFDQLWLTGQMQSATNGVTNFLVTTSSGYTGAGTLFLSDDGTYKAGSGLGTTINPTDDYLPVRSGATTFADSGLYRVGVTNVALDSQIIFGPGATNVLYRGTGNDAGNLVYTNGTTTGYGFTLVDPASASNLGRFQIVSGGSVRITSTAAAIQLDVSGSANYTYDSGQFHPGTTGINLGATTAQWEDLYLDNNIVWNGTTNSLFDTWGIATPEGSKTARPGSISRNTSASGVAYVKTDGTGNTGWQPVHVGNMASLAADGTSGDTTMANLSISAGVIAGKKYSFKLIVFLANSTPTDGAKFDFEGGSATATNFRVHGTAFGSALSGSAQSSAMATDHTVATVTGDNMMEFNGSFEPSASGTFIPRFAENVDAGGTLTVYRGSNLILTEIP